MQEYGFSLTRILPYKDRIVNFVLIQDNAGQWKAVFLHILYSVIVLVQHIMMFECTVKILLWNVINLTHFYKWVNL